ncbi:MAG TPA: MoaD/ThiS family protein [Gallionellaceae bacterium]
MKIKLLYFGRPRENLRLSQENAELPLNTATVADLLGWLRRRGPDWAAEMTENRVRCAINQELGTPASPLRDGDEVAIFSPISGG